MILVYQHRPQSFLRVKGSDAAVFLQGQFTNDLRQGDNAAVYGLFLNQKGKVVADSQALRLEENDFLLVSEHASADILRLRLEQYIIADDVTLADAGEDRAALALWGEGCGDQVVRILGLKPAPGRFERHGECLVFGGRRTRGENFEIVGPKREIEELHRQLATGDCHEVGEDEAEFVRIASGIAAIPGDIGAADLPNEGGLDAGAISYTKGCYLGQEVMARLKNLGQIRRRLHVVTGNRPEPAERAALFQGDRKVGEIRSVAGRAGEFVAMAMLSLPNLDSNAGLSLAAAAPATLRILPHG